MRRGIRILVVLAAALSVVAIPIVIALVGSRQTETWAAVATVGATAAALLSFVFSSFTYWQSGRIHAAVEERAKQAAQDPRGYVIVLTEGPADIQLLQEFRAIEHEAQRLLGEGTNTSVIRLRSRLLESGVWSERDVYDFDVALRTRNEIAHGEQRDVSRTSMSQAIETIRRLRQKVEANQLQEDS